MTQESKIPIEWSLPIFGEKGIKACTCRREDGYISVCIFKNELTREEYEKPTIRNDPSRRHRYSFKSLDNFEMFNRLIDMMLQEHERREIPDGIFIAKTKTGVCQCGVTTRWWIHHNHKTEWMCPRCIEEKMPFSPDENVGYG